MNRRLVLAIVVTSAVAAMIAGIVVWRSGEGAERPPSGQDVADGAAALSAPTSTTSAAAEPTSQVVTLWPAPAQPAPRSVFHSEANYAAWVADRGRQFPEASRSSWQPMPAGSYGSSGTYAAAFTDRVLRIDFATQDRDDLLGWLLWEVAPYNDAPDWNQPLSARAIFSAAQPLDPPNTQYPLVPTAEQWDALAAQDARQRVRDVLVMPDPAWQERVRDGRGTELTGDPKTDCVDVSATVDRIAGAVTQTKDLTWRMCVGTALNHSGVGLSAVAEVLER